MKKTKEIKHQKSSNINTVKSSKLSFVFRPFSSILLVLRRLEFLGLYSYLKIQPSLGRRSSSFQSSNSLASSSIKRLAKLRITGYFATMALLFLSFATISPIYIEHAPAEAESGTATPSILTFTSIKNSASVNLNVTSKDGTFATSTAAEMAQFSISTNNYTGYTLKLRSIGSITTLSGDTTNINTISTTTTKTTFENTTSLNNHWGYIPSHYNSQVNNNNSYYPAPTNTNAATIMVTNSANGSTTHPATSDTYTIGLGLRADYTNPSGTYTNSTFILEYVANKVDYVINYSAGSIAGVSGFPIAPTSGSTSGNMTGSGGNYTTDTTTITLTSTVPTRTGYDFVGWCHGTLNADGTECTGTPGEIYESGASFGIDNTADNINIILYAVWEALGVSFDQAFAEAGVEKLNGYYRMQDMTDSICSAVQPSTGVMSGQLIDMRDGTVYNVAKLPDEKCWLIDNLALDLTNSNVQANLTSSTTNASDTTLGYLKNGGGTASDKYAKNGVSLWVYSDFDPHIDMTSKDTVLNAGIDGAAGGWKVGGYYNYCAASAGSYCYEQVTPAGNAIEDICPRGWRLPTGGSDGEYQALYDAYSSNDFEYRKALSLPFSGGNFSNDVSYQGEFGYFWSSTRHSDDPWQVYRLEAFTEWIDASYAPSYLDCGLSVRCIAAAPLENIYTMNYPMFSFTANNKMFNMGGNPIPSGFTENMGWIMSYEAFYDYKIVFDRPISMLMQVKFPDNTITFPIELPVGQEINLIRDLLPYYEKELSLITNPDYGLGYIDYVYDNNLPDMIYENGGEINEALESLFSDDETALSTMLLFSLLSQDPSKSFDISFGVEDLEEIYNFIGVSASIKPVLYTLYGYEEVLDEYYLDLRPLD